MGWKNWPYWLKGGIILSLLYIVISLIYYIFIQMTATTGEETMAVMFIFIFPLAMLYGIKGVVYAVILSAAVEIPITIYCIQKILK